MSVLPRQRDVAAAFAKQARSDFAVYDLLFRSENLPKCHRLHYLQMVAEKSCKAYLYSTQLGTFRQENKHAVVEKVLSVVAREPGRKLAGSRVRQIRTHAYHIDRLAPAVDDQARPDNVEYPWFRPDGQVTSPMDHDFPAVPDADRQFTSTLKLLRELAQISSGT